MTLASHYPRCLLILAATGTTLVVVKIMKAVIDLWPF